LGTRARWSSCPSESLHTDGSAAYLAVTLSLSLALSPLSLSPSLFLAPPPLLSLSLSLSLSRARAPSPAPPMFRCSSSNAELERRLRFAQHPSPLFAQRPPHCALEAAQRVCPGLTAGEVCVCVCMREREGERGRERGGERERAERERSLSLCSGPESGRQNKISGQSESVRVSPSQSSMGPVQLWTGPMNARYARLLRPLCVCDAASSTRPAGRARQRSPRCRRHARGRTKSPPLFSSLCFGLSAQGPGQGSRTGPGGGARAVRGDAARSQQRRREARAGRRRARRAGARRIPRREAAPGPPGEPGPVLDGVDPSPLRPRSPSRSMCRWHESTRCVCAVCAVCA
jgi:hypothetical protein